MEFEPKENDKKVESNDSEVFEIKNYVYNLIRTTQRNYIDLTNIADNKANILVSINSLMLTILIPIILANYEIILDRKLYIPISFFALTCLITIIISVRVLTPFQGDVKKNKIKLKEKRRSPFFFTDYADLTSEEYFKLFQETVKNKENNSHVVIEDLYYFGKGLDIKYNNLKKAYKLFNIGLLLSFITFILVIFI